jgi:hypothetical protein
MAGLFYAGKDSEIPLYLRLHAPYFYPKPELPDLPIFLNEFIT